MEYRYQWTFVSGCRVFLSKISHAWCSDVDATVVKLYRTDSSSVACSRPVRAGSPQVVCSFMPRVRPRTQPCDCERCFEPSSAVQSFDSAFTRSLTLFLSGRPDQLVPQLGTTQHLDRLVQQGSSGALYFEKQSGTFQISCASGHQIGTAGIELRLFADQQQRIITLLHPSEVSADAWHFFFLRATRF